MLFITLYNSPITNGINANIRTISHCANPNGTVSNIGCKKGTYNTTNKSKNEKVVPYTNVLLLKTPILNNVYFVIY